MEAADVLDAARRRILSMSAVEAKRATGKGGMSALLQSSVEEGGRVVFHGFDSKAFDEERGMIMRACIRMRLDADERFARMVTHHARRLADEGEEPSWAHFSRSDRFWGGSFRGPKRANVQRTWEGCNTLGRIIEEEGASRAQVVYRPPSSYLEAKTRIFHSRSADPDMRYLSNFQDSGFCVERAFSVSKLRFVRFTLKHAAPRSTAPVPDARKKRKLREGCTSP